MTMEKRRGKDIRWALGVVCLGLAFLALFFPVCRARLQAPASQTFLVTAREQDVSAESLAGRINVNTADAAALTALPGIGKTLAARIIAAREACGGFAYAEDLLQVPGIGAKKLEAIRSLICFEQED